MKILLINAVSIYVKQKAIIPLGLLSIATYLTQHGHTVKIYDRSVDGGSLGKHLNIFSPDFVGISSLGGRSFDDAMKVSKIVKKRNIPVVWGGHMPSAVPDILLKSGNIDFIVIGEGEITILALINAIIEKTSLRDVDGLAFIENGEIIMNKEREAADLSQLPIIDFSFVDPKKYFFKNMQCKRMLHVYASRGCTGNCAYCYSPDYSKRVWRARPPEYYLKEIKYLVDNFDVDGVYFVDDLLSPNKNYLLGFCNNIIESGINFFWSCDMRADTLTKEEIQMMYSAGCRWLFFGIETGTVESQNSIKKGLNLEKAEDAINYCNEIGISTTITFITALPDETEDDLKESIQYIRKINAKVKIPAIFGPFPNTEMYYELEKTGKLATPQSYEEWGKLATMDTIGKNFSKVPDKDIKVVTSYFFFSIFTNKYDIDDSKKRMWAKRIFYQAIDMLKRGNLTSIYLVFLSTKEFLAVVYYATMFPKIRKKYDLFNKEI